MKRNREKGSGSRFGIRKTSVYPGFVEHLRELVDPVQEHLHLVLEVLPVLGGPVGLALQDVDLLLLLEQVRLDLILVGLCADQRVLQGEKRSSLGNGSGKRGSDATQFGGLIQA